MTDVKRLAAFLLAGAINEVEGVTYANGEGGGLHSFRCRCCTCDKIRRDAIDDLIPDEDRDHESSK